MFVDLHVHSVFSDGMLTPEQLVSEALAARVSLIALADHNTIAGCPAMRAACRQAKIACIDAVEIDTIYKGEDLHILAYGFAPGCRAFEELVAHSRSMLDKMSDDLVRALARDGKDVSLEEYAAYPQQTGRGGWKALYYLQEKLALPSIYDVFPLYEKYGVGYAQAGFARAEETIRLIHSAGGIAVLAHPGDVSRLEGRVEAAEMTVQMQELFRLGLDGAECHYPKHSVAETALFTDACLRADRLITSGSDCHGAFSGKPVGFLRKTAADLRLGALLGRAH